MLGATGGAPGVDIESLFGVAATRVEGDLACITRALQTGVIEVWTSINWGDASLAPTRRYMLPDADADAERASRATRRTAFQADIQAARANGFVVDKDYVELVAAQYDIEAPQLPAEGDATAPTIALAPADLASVVTVNEARASAGLGVLTLRDGTEDPDGFISVGEYAAKKATPKPGVAPPVGSEGQAP